MKNIGLCTHFSQTDDWAFNFAFDLVQRQGWQLTICHWLNSPYNLRREMVYPSLWEKKEPQQITPELLVKLELELREYFEPKLGDFTDVAFKLCEGLYQVELMRCFRQNLLDLVVIGHIQEDNTTLIGESLEEFARGLSYPLVIVGPNSPDQFLLNQASHGWLEDLNLEVGSWQIIEPAALEHR
jgi:hypothetical protein